MGNEVKIVAWEDFFVTGITSIDNQHKGLVPLINTLYKACVDGDSTVDTAFREAMSKMVEYVRFHFTIELKFLKKIKYPFYNDHKSEHNVLINQILAAAEEYKTGKKFVPHTFARTLKDWVLSHIAVTDKLYAAYVAEQIKKGLLSVKEIEAIIAEGM